MSARQVWDPMKNTGHGRPTGPKGKRSNGDSLPHHVCPVPDCGEVAAVSDFCHWELTNHDVEGARFSRWFCSLGCLGRWAALEEVRQS